MKVFFVSAEATPFAKVGGLADVAGSLPKALQKLGVDIKLVIPKYGSIEDAKFGIKLIDIVDVELGGDVEKVNIFEAKDENLTVYLLGNEKYFDRKEIYGAPDDLQRFTLFSKGVLEMSKKIQFRPDVIHIQDWHTGMIAPLLKVTKKEDEFYKDTKVVFTIHNLGYQGLFHPDSLNLIGLPWSEFTMEKLEFYGNVNFLKAGIVYSDIVNTVSETYSKEIQTPEFGEGLDGLLRSVNNKLYGIVNGIDYSVWNPEIDKEIYSNYSFENILVGKIENKVKLQKDLKLPQKKTVPFLGMVSRLSSQKGFDITLNIIEKILKEDLQIVILGTGDKTYEEKFLSLAQSYNKKLSVYIGFNNTLAHRIYAGCDMFLMPSRYEPCGLGQMIAIRYGTIPIVRKTGGLGDTVSDFNTRRKTGCGFVFEEYSENGLYKAIKRALKVYSDKKLWKILLDNSAKCDFSWEASAKKYLQLYSL